MAETKRKYANELDNFESLQIKMASTEKILKWSHGEVTKPETINYRSLKPEKDGLFCEKIFGPTKDWECNCRKYKSIRYKGIVCDRCGVEVTKAKVRRERMGHIELATPVSHIWYFKGTPSRISTVLEMTPKDVEAVLYFSSYVILDDGGIEDKLIEKKHTLSEEQYREKRKEYGDKFKVGTGADAIRKLLAEIDLDELSAELRKRLEEADKKSSSKKGTAKKATVSQKKTKDIRRLEVVESLRISGNRPEWMILEVIPVIPPDLRPMVQLDGGRFATSDLNDLYRRVINRNNRLKRLLELGAPDIIVRNEKRMLQEAVDSLIDNGKRGRAVTGPGGRPLKSLSDMLKCKQGRFRQNLLGKRVDYSGRSVIVVGPELKFYQCGLPKKMALELFKPFIMRELVAQKDAPNIKSAKKMVEATDPLVWDALDTVIKDHPVLLNRAPTLHRLGIQAFEPVLVEGKAIKLHPLVCTPFNADFDGDQMAVHVPLSVEAQAEARFLMLSVNNILAPKDGLPITAPSQDMILGAYYLTYPGTCKGPKWETIKDPKTGKEKQVKAVDEKGEPIVVYRADEFADKKTYEKNKKEEFERIPEKGDGKAFSDINEMLMAYQEGIVGIHARVKVRIFKDEKDTRGRLVESTVGRFIYNQGFPQDLGYVDRKKDPYSLEIDFLCDKNSLKEIINRCFRIHANTETVLMMDYIKSMGYKYSTKAAVTIGVDDMKIPDNKWDIINKSQEKVDMYEEAYRNGLITNRERYENVIEIWGETTERLANTLMDTLPPENNLNIMAISGARGNKNQIGQIGGMRGLMGNARGETVEIPIKANFREGLSVLEYFISSNGARKGLTDTALRTADSGYLTRRLVDVSHNVIVREDDCGTQEGVEVRALKNDNGNEDLLPLRERISGRTALNDIKGPRGKILVRGGEEITEEQAKDIEETGIESVIVRSAITCRSKSGICAKCYGRNLATGEAINIGESVGIIAAQSIGEPGTQLTMRTFHTGGVAGGDITQGLPRVEELFEARSPKGLAKICEADGKVVSMDTDSTPKRIVVKSKDPEDIPERTYEIAAGDRPIVKSIKVGSELKAGDNITEGPLNPHDIMRLQGVQGVYKYITKEVQKVYKREGVDINDKHIEIIISQMLSKFEITDPGDTYLLPGGMYSRVEIEEANEKAESEGKQLAKGKHTLLGITKASLATTSFLSAASFQETTKVLTDAAVKGKTDELLGLKENVIIGKLIPAGTGMKVYRDIDVDYGENQEYIEAYMENLRKEREEEANLARAAKLAEREAAGGSPLVEAPAREDADEEVDNSGIDSIITDLQTEALSKGRGKKKGAAREEDE